MNDDLITSLRALAAAQPACIAQSSVGHNVNEHTHTRRQAKRI